MYVVKINKKCYNKNQIWLFFRRRFLDKHNKNKMLMFSGFMKNITMVTQFGLSLLMPLLMCLGACWWLVTKVGLGAWVYIPGFIFGLGSSFMVAYRLYLSVLKKEEKILSRKRKDEAGIGIRSMQQICEKYNGTSRFEAAGNQFEASFMIHI